MPIKPGTYCPLIKKDCIQFSCAWWTKVSGRHPQTGEPVDDFSCAITWMPMLLIETAKQSHAAGAATESMRNEIVKRMDGVRPLVSDAPALTNGATLKAIGHD
jgi:hypothetical protein